MSERTFLLAFVQWEKLMIGPFDFLPLFSIRNRLVVVYKDINSDRFLFFLTFGLKIFLDYDSLPNEVISYRCQQLNRKIDMHNEIYFAPCLDPTFDVFVGDKLPLFWQQRRKILELFLDCLRYFLFVFVSAHFFITLYFLVWQYFVSIYNQTCSILTSQK